MDADKKSGMDDPDLELIKARKMKKLQEQLASLKKKTRSIWNSRIKQIRINQKESILKGISCCAILDRGDEVLKLAEQQFPLQTKIIIKRLNELIRFGEISKISGGDMLAVYRSLGLNIRVDTQISISDHGKTISFSDKLKQSSDTDQDSDELL